MYLVCVDVFIVSQGEVHKLFWPEQQEFVRMAAKFGATIVPFGCVGEDDVSEVRNNFFLDNRNYIFFFIKVVVVNRF